MQLDENGRKVIIVNNIAASKGGGLSIMRQFLSELKVNKESKAFHWIVFLSNDLLKEYEDNHIELIKINMKKWHKRIWWDTFGIKNKIRSMSISPVLAISFMNVGMKYLRTPQLIYIQQSLPFGDFTKFKWFEWKTRFYKWGIGKWMHWTIRKDSTIVVQTNWMKKEVSKELGISYENIHVIKPVVDFRKSIGKYNEKKYKLSHRLLYPSSAMSYKNHELLIYALAEISSSNPKLLSQLKVVFTCKHNESRLTRYIAKLSSKLGVSEVLHWAGYLSRDQLMREYAEADMVLFPSKIETIGLPLIEARAMRKTIITLDKPYAHDALENYKGAIYVADDAILFAEAIENFYRDGPIEYDEEIHLDNSGWLNFLRLVENMVEKYRY